MTEDEFLPLFDQYHNMVYRIALVSIRSQQDAEDIVQTVFLKLLEGKTLPMPGHERASADNHYDQYLPGFDAVELAAKDGTAG